MKKSRQKLNYWGRKKEHDRERERGEARMRERKTKGRTKVITSIRKSNRASIVCVYNKNAFYSVYFKCMYSLFPNFDLSNKFNFQDLIANANYKFYEPKIIFHFFKNFV